MTTASVLSTALAGLTFSAAAQDVNLLSRAAAQPECLTTAVMDDPESRADHDAGLTERFNSWLAGS